MMNPDVIFTTYFTGKPDPQSRSRGRFNYFKKFKTWIRSRRGGAAAEKHGVAAANDFERIRVWYESLIKVGCKGVIFYDHLSEEFVRRWSCPEVEFVHYKLESERSMNDERYYCYLQYLRANQHIENLFVLDLFDIEFFRNPFELFDPEEYDLYCGGDAGEYNNKLVRDKMIAAFGTPFYESEIKLNAGTCGGSRANMEALLVTMTNAFDQLTERGTMENLNMAVFNKCVYDLFDKHRILWGSPLNSRFKAYEASGNFAIRHK